MAKLIEKDFPFARLSQIAERESWRKEVYRPIYYIQKWWARRLGSVFRGILLSSCLDEQEDFWDRFYGSNNFGGKTVFDPFMGSGVTVGEAIKLGCRVIGRDINPVAFIACSAAFSRYSVIDVLSEYKRLEQTLAPKLLSYFQTQTSSGESATVLYYFLVKTVVCPECGDEIDLFSTRIFSKNATPGKDPSARCLCPVCGEINYTVFNAKRLTCPKCETTYNPQDGNIKGPKVTCNHCQQSFRLVDRMKSIDGPLPYRRYAKMILKKDGQKTYEPMNIFDKNLEYRVKEEYKSIVDSFPIVVIEPGYNTNQILKHNYKNWHRLFSDRQLVCIRHILNGIKEVQNADLRVLFSCLFSGMLEFNNLFTSFKGEGTGAVRHMFSHHVLKPEMMPLEANIWGTPKSSGSFSTLFRSRVMRALTYKSDPFELRIYGANSIKVPGINQAVSIPISDNYYEFNSQLKSVYLSAGDSSCMDMPDRSVDLVVTDPPFFDNVHYSQLADIFFYWLNQILEISSITTTRSPKEVQDTDSVRFTEKLTAVFAECNRLLKDTGLFVFTYHHARHEGWTSVHRAIRHSGFICTQAYPIKSEMSVSMPLRQAKSPIHLDLIFICRKKSEGYSSSPAINLISNALDIAKAQIFSLKSAGINLSLGDAKVVMMGRLLCEVHKLKNLDFEEDFLAEIEQNINAYVDEINAFQGEVFYRQEEQQQLRLFEEVEKMLVKKVAADAIFSPNVSTDTYKR
jgi:hypothetical protein